MKKQVRPFAILAALALGGVLIPIVLLIFAWQPSTANVMESASPTGKEAVITAQVHHYDGPIVSLYVRDVVANGSTPMLLATLEEGVDFDSLIWSADGAVVALTISNQLQHAYSFSSHKVLRATGTSATSGNMTTIFSPTPSETDAYLQSVLKAHGGAGQVIDDMPRRELGFWASRPFLRSPRPSRLTKETRRSKSNTTPKAMLASLIKPLAQILGDFVRGLTAGWREYHHD